MQTPTTPPESKKGVHPLETEMKGEMREGYRDLKGHAENTSTFSPLRKYSTAAEDEILSRFSKHTHLSAPV